MLRNRAARMAGCMLYSTRAVAPERAATSAAPITSAARPAPGADLPYLVLASSATYILGERFVKRRLEAYNYQTVQAESGVEVAQHMLDHC